MAARALKTPAASIGSGLQQPGILVDGAETAALLLAAA
jgi:hypothetical protein